jgi:hypothetical protein
MIIGINNLKNYKNYKKYFTQFNYEAKYLVYINNDVYIFERDNKNEINTTGNTFNKKYYTKFVKHYKPIKFFIGKSKNEIPINNKINKYIKYFNGNTILLQINNNKYVQINGLGIKTFTLSDDKIIKYFSPIIYNGFSYPIAISEKNIYFLFNGFNCYLSKDIIYKYLSIKNFNYKNLIKIIDRQNEIKPICKKLKVKE